MTTGERIRARRKDLRLSADDLARAVGVSRATIFRYENGYIEKLPGLALEPLAKALDTSVAYLMGWDDNAPAEESQTNVVDIPFLGDVAAGYDWLANPEYGCLRVPSDWLRGHRAANFFALRVVGSSMYPMFCEGDEILCLRTPDMGASGRIGVIVYNGDEVTLKKIEYKQGEDWLDLVPINPEYQTKRIEGADLEQCRVLGRVLRVIRTVDEM